MAEMKRYAHEYHGPGDNVGGRMNEADDGEWVRYSDAQAEIARLRETLHVQKLLNEAMAETALKFRRQAEAVADRAEAVERVLAAAQRWAQFTDPEDPIDQELFEAVGAMKGQG